MATHASSAPMTMTAWSAGDPQPISVQTTKSCHQSVTIDDRRWTPPDLLHEWQALIRSHTDSPHAIATGRALLASWLEPHRRYHTIGHLLDVLCSVDELAAHAVDSDAVRLAAWYHDAVYRGSPDDEENSARRAESELAACDVTTKLIEEVVRLVRLTATHRPMPGDRNGETLCDADLAILGASPDRYRRYTAAVRAEYPHLPDPEFRAGRSKLLRQLLERRAIYRTPAARARWEAQARANLSSELHRIDCR
jgi:predicted metal-dependent HD superfamily phosphohydrolase